MTTLSARNQPSAGPLRPRICGRRAIGRLRLEHFVVEKYAAVYRARVHDFLPTLLGLECGAEIVGVIGARRARPVGRLFVESYLDVPVEKALGARVGAVIPRYRIAEVGNLATSLPGGNRMLVTTFAAYLDARGIEWAVFAATKSLRNAFERLGVTLHDLGSADGARLGERATDWGAYYETDPRVTAVRVDDVCSRSAQQPRLRARLEGAWHAARATGLVHSGRATA